MSAPRPETALFDLLCELFDGRELVRFASQTYGRELLQDLPDQGSLGDIAFALIGLLSRRALILPALFDALVAVRPGRYSQIAAVAMRWNIALPAVVDVPIAGSPSHASVAPSLDAAEDTTSPESWPWRSSSGRAGCAPWSRSASTDPRHDAVDRTGRAASFVMTRRPCA